MRCLKYQVWVDIGELMRGAVVFAMALWTSGLSISCTPSSTNHIAGSAASQAPGEIPDCQHISAAPCPAPSETASKAPVTQNSSGQYAQNARWAYADRWASLQKAVERRRSQHLQEAVDAEVYVNEQAAAYRTLGPVQRLGPGALIVEALFEPGAEKPMLLFVMEKQKPGTFSAEGDFSFLIVSPEGAIKEQGAMTLCVRCHAEAPYMFLFGPPKGAL